MVQNGFDPGTAFDTIKIESASDELLPGDPVTITFVSSGGTDMLSYPATYSGFVPGSDSGGTAQDAIVTLTPAPGISFNLRTSNSDLDAGDHFAVDTAQPFVCFAEGTLIATPDGEVAVETLQAGDVILTADGATATVRWLGRQSVATAFASAERLSPVVISAGALAPNVPASDLTVTADHGIVFDEAIVHAAALVNGTTIRRVEKADLPAVVRFFHIETEHHDVVLANGCAAETFIDNVGRKAFDNYGEYEAAYGNEQPAMNPIDLPRALGPRQVPAAVRDRIAERAAALSGNLATAV